MSNKLNGMQIAHSNEKPTEVKVVKPPDFFTKGQKSALIKMVEWANGNDLFFVLEGPAGTGKTTLLNAFLKETKHLTSVITAPTHKAVRVASQMVGKKGVTLQKLMGLRPNFNVANFDINRIPFDPLGKRSVGNYMLIPCDEASMISSPLLKFLKKEATTFKTKILFIGDPYQLPPVGEKQSPAFIIEPKFKSVLTEVVRQAEANPITELLIQIRKSIKNRNYDYINYMLKQPNSIKDGKGFMIMNDVNKFSNFVKQAFNDKRLEKNIDWCKYLSYTKIDVLAWNEFIRKSIFPDIDKALHINDLLMAHNTIVNEFNEAKITNSEDYIIKDIMPYRNHHDIEGFNINLTSVFDGGVTPYMFVVDPYNIDSMERFKNIANNMITKAYARAPGSRGALFKEYYAFKEQNLLIVDVVKGGGMNAIDKDLDYGFALTTHKSQGSTFNNVFVNLRNIIHGNGTVPNQNIDFVNRLFYVAASRSKENLIILF